MPVVALHERHPRLQVDLQPFVVPYVQEREMRKVDGGPRGVGVQSTRELRSTSSRNSSSLMIDTPCFSASVSFDPAFSPATR